MPTKPITTGLVLAALAVSGLIGWVAGKSNRPPLQASVSPEGTGATGSRPDAAVPGERSDAASAGSHRETLRELLMTARGDLLGGGLNQAGKIRAAARIALIDPADLPAALELVASFEGGLYRHEGLAALLLERWATFDGAAACAFAIKSMDPPMMGLHPVRHPLSAWASVDPGAAMAWFQSRKNEEGGVMGAETKFGEWIPISDIRWIMGAWAMVDPDAAVQAFNRLETKEERSGAITGLMEGARQSTGRTAILDAVFEAPDDGNDRVWRLLSEWSVHDPAELAAWIDTKEIKKSNFFMHSKDVLGSWLLVEQQAAIDWWLDNDGGHPGRDGKLGRLIDAWVEVDVIAASEWLAAQKLTEDYSQAVRSLSNRLNRDDPATGFDWADAVPAEWARRRALESAYKAWFKRDPVAARAALQTVDLPAKQRAEIEASTETDPAPTRTTRL